MYYDQIHLRFDYIRSQVIHRGFPNSTVLTLFAYNTFLLRWCIVAAWDIANSASERRHYLLHYYPPVVCISGPHDALVVRCDMHCQSITLLTTLIPWRCQSGVSKTVPAHYIMDYTNTHMQAARQVPIWCPCCLRWHAGVWRILGMCLEAPCRSPARHGSRNHCETLVDGVRSSNGYIGQKRGMGVGIIVRFLDGVLSLGSCLCSVNDNSGKQWKLGVFKLLPRTEASLGISQACWISPLLWIWRHQTQYCTWSPMNTQTETPIVVTWSWALKVNSHLISVISDMFYLWKFTLAQGTIWIWTAMNNRERNTSTSFCIHLVGLRGAKSQYCLLWLV